MKKLQNLKKKGGILLLAVAMTVTAFPQLSTSVHAEEPRNIQSSEFDSYFWDTYLKEYDTNNSNSLSDDEISKIIDLDMKDDQKLTSLKGIKYLTDLDGFSCESTNVKELDVSGLTKLKYLICPNTGITKLDVSTLTSLISLNCSNTNITELDVSMLKDLSILHCSDTNITSLDVSMFNLGILNCTNNNLAYLNLSEYRYLDWYFPTTAKFDVTATDNTIAFDDFAKDIDVSKVTVTSNGTLSGNQIIVTDITKPVIYTYKCRQDATLTVTLNITSNEGVGKSEFDSYFWNTYLKQYDTNNSGSLSDNEISQITELNMSKDQNLTSLKGIKYLTNLEKLYCNDTDIAELDVSSLTNLATLSCGNTNITTLDVSRLTKLTYLDCSDTDITTLDIRNLTKLQFLYLSRTKLAYFEYGSHTNIRVQGLTNASFNVTATDKKIALNDFAKGIDASKVTVTNNGTLSGNMIVVDDLTKPVIYTYNCGIGQTLTVTLHIGSTFKITGRMNKDYDGSPVSNPAIIKDESITKDVSFTWYKPDSKGEYQKLKSAPVNAGPYKVVASVEAYDNFAGVSDEKEFVIFQADNGWTEELSIAGWTYGDTANVPTATAKFGDVTFTYSNAEDGTYTADVPKEAGTYYVKASVDETENYTGLSQTAKFDIKAKDNENTGSQDTGNTPGKGDSQDTGNKPGKGDNAQIGVKTGDTSNIFLWGMITVLSALGVVLVIVKKRRMKRN